MFTQLSQQQLQAIMQTCPQAMLLVDETGLARWMNDLLAEILGEQAALLLDRGIEDVPEPLQSLFIENSTVHLAAANDYDEDRWLLASTRSLGENAGFMQFFTDISAIQQLVQERDHLANELEEYILVDRQSGMPNRRALYQSLESQVSRSRRYHNPLSVILMRLNNLDDYISATQNKNPASLFISLRYMLNDQLRWADIIGRLDENELLMVLPETHVDDALTLAQKVSHRIEALDLPELETSPGLENFQLDTHFGVAEWRKGDDVGLLMTRIRTQMEQELLPQV
ncbi:hypothetical protein MNBD_GAMMA24-2155 [hydrothermal vent metagenome]|uniref:GGDEF domain-containing protein n=1 Tax=hydrothermal vent metagenome TaxID=652676 RepID=A0A3B1BPU5_9ZZZZ